MNDFIGRFERELLVAARRRQSSLLWKTRRALIRIWFRRRSGRVGARWPGTPDRRLVRPWRILTAGVAAAALAATASSLDTGSRELRPAVASAADVLDAAASAAGARREPLMARDRYFYARSRYSSITWASRSSKSRRVSVIAGLEERWTGFDGSGRYRSRTRQERPIHPARPDRLLAPRRGEGPAEYEERFGKVPGGASYLLGFVDSGPALSTGQLLRLPARPRALYKRIRAAWLRHRESWRGSGLASTLDRNILHTIAYLMTAAPSPPRLRAALYKAAALIPRIRLLGPATDHAGRAGMAVGIDELLDGERTTFMVIFDPSTARLLEERTVQLNRSPALGVPPGTIVDRTTYIASGVVDSREQRVRAVQDDH